MTLSDSIKKFDAQHSVPRELRVYTAQGALLSIITLCIILYLVITEVYFNFQVTLQERVHVNATSPTGLEIEFDLTLDKVPCKNLEIDAADPTGQSQSLHLDHYHHVWKHRVLYDEVTGRIQHLGHKERLEFGSTLLSEQDVLTMAQEIKEKVAREELEQSTCGSCYGAGEEGECCSTCDDVRRVYKKRGWGFPDVQEIRQCRKEMDDSESGGSDGEGCNVHGIVALSTGGGNFHLAPGSALSVPDSGVMNIFDLIFQSYKEWNVTHTIHKLRFGQEYPDAIYQLDGQVRTIADGHGMYQYYFQIVPTRYKFLNGTVVQSNQYSVTEHMRHVNPGSNRGVPGVFFFYELSPLHVEISEVYRKGYLAFFTSVCAIVGGVVTVMGMIDSCIFSQLAGRSLELAR